MKLKHLSLIVGISLMAIAPSMDAISSVAHLDSTKNVAFLWDMDAVVLEPKGRISLIIKTLLTHPSAPFRAKKLANEIGKDPSAEEMIALAKERGWNDVAQFVEKIARKKKPIEGTVKIIEELRAKGFPMYVGTNIGTPSFTTIMTGNGKAGRFLRANFNLDHPQTVDYKSATIIKKPNVEFFNQAIAKNQFDLATTHVIFIDDRTDNVEAARKAGMIGIVFKNPKQLRTDLKELGLL
jgi:beta-phosphoglucomutase-like phosphatase (HAD superfamily)